MRVDVHCHLRGEPGYLDELLEHHRAASFDRFCLSAVPAWHAGTSNDQVLAAAREHPDTIVPLAGFRLGDVAPDELERARDQGFAGFKTMGPRANYHDRAFWPVYEKAQHLGLPILFHTGIVAPSLDDRANDTDSARMRPVFLDTVARQFPGLPVIVAHLGNPWSDELAMSLRWHPNLYADMSGSLLTYRPHGYLRQLLWWGRDDVYRSPDGKTPLQKILFGSDVRGTHLPGVVRQYEAMLDAFDATDAERTAVFGDSAADLFGLTKGNP